MDPLALLRGLRLTPIMKAGSKEVDTRKPTAEQDTVPKLKESKMNPLEPPNFTPGDPVVTVTANFASEITRKFIIHKEFACYYSPVLKAAFNSDFVEGKTQIYELKDIQSEVVQLLVRWLYTQKVELRVELLSEDVESYQANFNKSLPLAVRLWVLADMLIIHRLQNDVSDYIWTLHHDKAGSLIATHTLKYVYKNTLPGSPLRRLFIMVCARCLDSETYKTAAESFPQEMFSDLVVHFAAHRHGHIWDANQSKEYFHVDRSSST